MFSSVFEDDENENVASDAFALAATATAAVVTAASVSPYTP